MKDKITIDGVDVSGCKSFCENYGEYYQGYWEDNEICYLHNNHCSDNPNCYYKQLLAEQAKNKKLIKDFGAKYIEWEKTFLQNKKLVEALESIKKLKHKEMCCCDAVDNNIIIIKLVKQALNEVNNAK